MDRGVPRPLARQGLELLERKIPRPMMIVPMSSMIAIG